MAKETGACKDDSHARKSIIDHLVQDLYEPRALDQGRCRRPLPASRSRDQVCKAWDPRKGGLPTFSRGAGTLTMSNLATFFCSSRRWVKRVSARREPTMVAATTPARAVIVDATFEKRLSLG
jgi:hypothetical protein